MAAKSRIKNLCSQPKMPNGREILPPDEANFRRHTCVYGKKIERSMAGKDSTRRHIEVVNTGSKTRQLTLCAVMAAVMCVIAPISVPIGPISVTGGTLTIYLTACLLGPRRGLAATAVYLLAGFAGLPVFSNYMGGAGRLLGPTGGYLVGYLPMMLLAGLAAEHAFQHFGGREKKALMAALQFLGMVLATAVLYAFGTAWYCVQAGVGLQTALAACVFPFIPFDLMKMILALLAGVPVRRRLEQAGML